MKYDIGDEVVVKEGIIELGKTRVVITEIYGNNYGIGGGCELMSGVDEFFSYLYRFSEEAIDEEATKRVQLHWKPVAGNPVWLGCVCGAKISMDRETTKKSYYPYLFKTREDYRKVKKAYCKMVKEMREIGEIY